MIKPSITHPKGVCYQGDCLKIMRQMDTGSVQLIISSPPYSSQRSYLENGIDLGIARKPEEWVTWMIEVVEESLRVCNGLVAFVIGHGSHGCRKWTGEPALLMADLIRKGFCLRNPPIYKRQGIQGSGSNDWLRADTEFIICVTNKPEKLIWSDNTSYGKPPKWPLGGEMTNRMKDGKRIQRKITTGGAKKGDIQTVRVDRVQVDIVNPGNLIDCGAVGGGHCGSNIAHDGEAPFPIKLPTFFIKSFCPPNGTVLDNFVGSGSTIQAAIECNRKFIGIDLRPSQIELCKRRIKQAESNKGFGI